MLIELKKSEVFLETIGTVRGLNTISNDGKINSLNSLNFEGFAGLNEKYIQPLLQMLYEGRNTDLFKVIEVSGNLHNDDSIHEATFYIIQNIRASAFLFKVLKSFSISLPDLRLGYEKSKTHEVLYLDKKILKILTNLDEAPRKELALFFYCIIRFLNTFTEVNPFMTTEGVSALTIASDSLEEMYKKYGTLEDTTLEFIQLKEDVFFGDMLYRSTSFALPIKNNIDTKFSSTFVYNVLKTSTAERLCIINVTTKEYYVIDLDTATIFTNNKLQEYNTFDCREWLPSLISKIHDMIPMRACYRIKYLTLEKLLSTKEPEIHISNDATKFEFLLDKYPYISENTNMKLYESYFKGSVIKYDGGVIDLRSQYDDDTYAQELFKKEQEYYKDFDLGDLKGIVKGVARGDIYSMLFEGESGTGKSTAARVIASRCGLPLIAINCSTNIEESDIIGTFIPNPHKENADDPEFIWQDGALTKCVRRGYVAAIEEIGFGRPGVLGKLNSLLDEARQLDLPNGEVIQAHPNFRLIATTNIGYEGTNRLNKALVNRFEICKKFVDLDEKEAKAIIISRTGYTNVDKINKVFDVYRAIKKFSKENNLGLVVSIRQLLTIFKQGKYYASAKDAIKNLMLNQAFLENEEYLEHFVATVLDAFDLTFKL